MFRINLLASGNSFEVDGFVNQSSLAVEEDFIFRIGDPTEIAKIRGANEPTRQDAGFTISIHHGKANREISDKAYQKALSDLEKFLEANMEELQKLSSWPGVTETEVLIFSPPNPFGSMNGVPNGLLGLLSDAGVALQVVQDFPVFKFFQANWIFGGRFFMGIHKYEDQRKRGGIY